MQTRFKNSEIFCLKWIEGTCIQRKINFHSDFFWETFFRGFIFKETFSQFPYQVNATYIDIQNLSKTNKINLI